jgi:hypothetical protein
MSVRTFVISFYSGSDSETVIHYGSGSDFLARYGSSSGSGSASQKVTVPTVPVQAPQRWNSYAQEAQINSEDLLQLRIFNYGVNLLKLGEVDERALSDALLESIP